MPQRHGTRSVHVREQHQQRDESFVALNAANWSASHRCAQADSQSDLAGAGGATSSLATEGTGMALTLWQISHIAGQWTEDTENDQEGKTLRQEDHVVESIVQHGREDKTWHTVHWPSQLALPPGSKLWKVFNPYTVKLSYSCTPIVATIVKCYQYIRFCKRLPDSSPRQSFTTTKEGCRRVHLTASAWRIPEGIVYEAKMIAGCADNHLINISTNIEEIQKKKDERRTKKRRMKEEQTQTERNRTPPALSVSVYTKTFKQFCTTA